MKKIFLILLLPVLIFGQPYQSVSNSSYTALTSNAVFTGVWEKVLGNYTYGVITVKSNQSSAASGLKVYFSKNGKDVNSVNSYSYTANDTLTNRFSFTISSGYVKVVYTNGATAQTSFSLTTTLLANGSPITSSGGMTIEGATNIFSSFVTGAATIGTTAAQLSGTSTPCKGIVITNYSTGKILFLIHDGSGTTSTGTPILYLGSIYVGNDNLNKVYLISDAASTDVRYLYYK